MAQDLDRSTPAAGCGSCPAVSRRGFMAACAGWAAAAAVPLSFAGPAEKPKVRLVFSHPKPDVITWPNIGFDYEGRGRELAAQLSQLCPQVEFLATHVVEKADAERVSAEDAQVDGTLVYLLGIAQPGRELMEKLAAADRPVLVVEDQYAGPYSLGFNDRAEKAGWKAVCLSTSRMKDVAEAARCFTVLKKGGTPEDFRKAARAVFEKNTAKAKAMVWPPDPIVVHSIVQSLQRLAASTILLVGRDPAETGKAVNREFGTQVVWIPHAELNEAYLAADKATAEAWADRWIRDAQKVIEPAREEIVKSGAMHVAMLAMMKKYNAQAITIRCLDGFYSGALQAFPCLGFVELNDSGLVGACEGDLASTITMLAMNYLVGRPGFISDPVIDTSTNRIIYAHCVASTKVFGPSGASNPYHIRDHSEDRKGAAVRSLLPLGRLTTTIKFLPGTRTLLFHQGVAVENVDLDKACRTKLAVEVKGDIQKLFNGWQGGWHRVTYYGDLREPVREMCRVLGVRFVEEA